MIDWNSFYSKGCVIFNSPEMFTYLKTPLSKSRWIRLPFHRKDKTYRVPLNRLAYHKPLKLTSELIFDRFFSSITDRKRLGYSHVWNGTDSHSCQWHNDYIEGSNVSILMYYSDVKGGLGGELMMRKSSDKSVTEIHLPKKYDIVIFSQEQIWQHRVGDFLDPNMERITVNFGFTIPELSYGFDH